MEYFLEVRSSNFRIQVIDVLAMFARAGAVRTAREKDACTGGLLTHLMVVTLLVERGPTWERCSS
jgi:hypothetical protein